VPSSCADPRWRCRLLRDLDHAARTCSERRSLTNREPRSESQEQSRENRCAELFSHKVSPSAVAIPRVLSKPSRLPIVPAPPWLNAELLQMAIGKANGSCWHIPEETVTTGKVRSLGMTGRVEKVPLPPSLTHIGHEPLCYGSKTTLQAVKEVY
jgi:hypothetical protein